MKHYHIDLRSFPIEEREKLYKLLKDSSYICNPFIEPGLIGIYDVCWDISEPIENILKISKQFIIPQF